jgi:hypothetical protein
MGGFFLMIVRVVQENKVGDTGLKWANGNCGSELNNEHVSRANGLKAMLIQQRACSSND